MPGATTHLYEKIFTRVRNIKKNPQYVVMDFLVALLTIIPTVSKDPLIAECFFYNTQRSCVKFGVI